MSKLSVKKRKELEALAERPDEEIDLSDIPEIREIPSDAVIGKFFRPKKTSVTTGSISRLRACRLPW